MADLRTQLRAYVEATIERVDIADVISVRAVAPEPRWYRRPAVVAVAAGAAVIVVIGGAALLGRWLRPAQPPVTTVATTTTTLPATSTTTTAPTTTTTTVPPTTTTTVAALDPAIAALWAAFDMALPQEEVPPFYGGGHIVNDLATNGEVVVAVGDAMNTDENYMRDGLVLISADGRVWERVLDHDNFDFGGKGLNAVVAGGPGFVIGGQACDTEERCTTGWRAALWTSVDGRQWQRVPHDTRLFGERSAVYDLLVREDQILALGLLCEEDACPTVIWSSPDGLSWERTDLSPDAWPGVIAEGPGGLVGVGGDGSEAGSWGAVWTSPDGVTWERVPDDPDVFGVEDGTYEGILDVAWGADGFVAVGSDGNNAIVWFSPDGATWERIPHDPEVFGGTTMYRVIAWGDGFVAAGPDWPITEEIGGPVPGMPSVPSRPTLWVSPDGRTWHRIGIGAEDALGAVRALVQFRGMLIAGGQNGVFMTGTDEDALWVNEQPPTPEGW